MLSEDKANGSKRMDEFCFLPNASIEILFKRFFLDLFILFYCMCIDALPACMSKHHLHAWYLEKLEEGTQIPYT